jgi:hypothetical protein
MKYSLGKMTVLLLMLSSAGCGLEVNSGNTSGGSTGGSTENPPVLNFSVTLIPQSGVSGQQRINFAIPLREGLLIDENRIRILQNGFEITAGRRGLARHPDGSWMSIQIQTLATVSGTTTLNVEVDQAPQTQALGLVNVIDTLATSSNGYQEPRVWVVLPAAWLAASAIAGPSLAQADIPASLSAWNALCDYDRWDTDAFLAASADGIWLFDRPTSFYRGYVITGSQSPLMSAYREASLYLSHVSGTGSSTRISLPGVSADDLKYHYTQGLALHYLLTGDDRFREAAENIAIRAHDLWADPGYAGGDDFWTERHAGFGLLAYEWAARVSDDRASTFAAWATEAVTAYLEAQEGFPSGQTPASWQNSGAVRCFSHTADAHGEDFGTTGCSPWMSGILADGLEAYATRVGGTAADDARRSLVKLGRAIAEHGRDPSGKPYYWMATGSGQPGEVDDFDEHWGESAYIVAMAWHYSGRSDSALKQAADALVAGLAAHGEVGQLRSFNWQCRSAVLAPAYLK